MHSDGIHLILVLARLCDNGAFQLANTVIIVIIVLVVLINILL
jgi:hypothetical protein